MESEALKIIGDLGAVPVATIDQAEDSIPLAEALLKGGLPVIEVTFRTATAKEALRAIAAYVPQMLVGAGTVLSVEQAESALEAGAQFIVSPGFCPRVVQYCLNQGVAVIPGCSSPTDLTAAFNFGLQVVKYFPAELLGGTAALEAIGKPFGGMKFIPTGGIGFHNLQQYLRLDKVWACGGSWMVGAQLIRNRDFKAISRLAKVTLSEILGFRLDCELPVALLEEISALFKLPLRESGAPYPAGSLLRRGESNKQLTVKTNNLIRAAAYFLREGIEVCAGVEATPVKPPAAIYLQEKAGGFDICVVEEQSSG